MTEFELPPYTYIPGQTPHPISDPKGHMHGQSIEEQLPTVLHIERGLFLFRSAYYWEAHEAWEHAWISMGRRGDVADRIKGLIKLAAAGVKVLEGNVAGAERHLIRGKELLSNTKSAEVQEFPSSSLDFESLTRQVELALTELKCQHK